MAVCGRYDTSGNWYKGNTHIHSTASDGGLTFAELAERYAGEGYSFLFRTDHWVMSDVVADTHDYPLLWLDGMEVDGLDGTGAVSHVVCLGSFKGISREVGLPAALGMVRDQGGVRILAHPRWSGNDVEDALTWGFDGVEVYNNVCWWLNAKGDAGAFWSAMLGRVPNTMGLAVDDAHIHPGAPAWNGGWVVANAPVCEREAIMASIRAGNFYSSRGPDFHSIEVTGSRIEARTSAVERAWLVGPGPRGIPVSASGGRPITQLAFDIPDEWDYAYLEIEDARGLRAWTNPL